MPNPVQELKQQVCQQYGWSLILERESSGRWSCRVQIGFDVVAFGTAEIFPDTIQGKKDGTARVCQLALNGLRSRIEDMERIPLRELHDVFDPGLPIVESNAETWRTFWERKPALVGIDVEGNQSSPPILVQISTDEAIILETPCISPDLRRLLADESIVKVFCDSFAHYDKKSLGIYSDKSEYTKGHILDVETLAGIHLGPVQAARGLGRILSLLTPGIRLGKPKKGQGKAKSRFTNVKRFALIEQGRAPPLRSIYDLSKEERQYAAVDAWCTLEAYRRLLDGVRSHSTASA